MKSRQAFLREVLGAGLELGHLRAEDVLRHVPPDVLVEVLPKGLVATLFAKALGARALDADLMLATLGLDAICEHVPHQRLWQSVEAAMRQALDGTAAVAAPAKPLAVASAPIRAPMATPPARAATGRPTVDSIEALAESLHDAVAPEVLAAPEPRPKSTTARATSAPNAGVSAEPAPRRTPTPAPATRPMAGASTRKSAVISASPAPAVPRPATDDADLALRIETEDGSGDFPLLSGDIEMEEEQLVEWSGESTRAGADAVAPRRR